MNKKKAVIISCFDWFEKRLKPINKYLSSEFEVIILLSDFDHIQKKEVLKKYEECTYVHVGKYNSNLSLSRICSHIGFAESVYKKLKEINPDLIYALIPPNFVAKKCIAYKENNKDCKVIFDIIDMWPESMPIGFFKRGYIAKLWKNMRNEGLEKADFLVTECDLYREQLVDVVNKKKVTTNYLYKHQDEEIKQLINAFFLKKIQNKHRNELVLGYVGSINNILDIDFVICLIEEIQKNGKKVRCKVIGEGNHREEFCGKIASVCTLEYYGTVFEECEKIKILWECDFGLNIMKNNISVGLSIKSLDYFSYGLPIINNIKGDTWKMVSEYNLGININKDNCNIIADEIEKEFIPYDIYKFYEESFSEKAYEDKLAYVFQSIL